MPRGFGKGRDRGRSSRTPSPTSPPSSSSSSPGRVRAARPRGAAAYLAGILRAEWWGWRCGRRRRRAAAAGGWVPAGTSLRRRVWSLASAGGALPTRALSAGGGGRRQSQGAAGPGGAGGCPPRLPPPRRSVSGGPCPTLARQAPASPHGWGEGAGRGARFYELPLPHHTKGKKAPGWDKGASGLFSKQGTWGRQEQIPGLQQAGQHPCAFTSPRELSFFCGEGGQQQAGSFYARYRPDLRGILPARLPYGASSSRSPLGSAPRDAPRQAACAQGSDRDPAASPCPGAARRCQHGRGLCGSAGDARQRRPLPSGAAPRQLFHPLLVCWFVGFFFFSFFPRAPSLWCLLSALGILSDR